MTIAKNRRKVLHQIAMSLALVVGFYATTVRTAVGDTPTGLLGNGLLDGMERAKQIVSELDLNKDQKPKIDERIQSTVKAIQDAMPQLQSPSDMSEEQQRQKMKDLSNKATQAIDDIQADLTADQRKNFAYKYAAPELNRFTDISAAVQKAAEKMDMTQDQKKRVASTIHDANETLSDYKNDLSDVKDYPAAVHLVEDLTQSMTEARQQLVDALGEEKTNALLQAAMKSLAPPAKIASPK
jgi:chromosome segregation ATPase